MKRTLGRGRFMVANVADALRLILPKRRTLIGFTWERAFRLVSKQPTVLSTIE
jgi:hypothetical protein